jgi:RNA polymerase sigma-70 factor (ECF subfamily)
LFRSGGHERAWLAAILRHRAADHRRRRKPPTVQAGDNSFEVGYADRDVFRDVFRDELSDEVQRAVETLPHDLRETLLLVVVAELTHQETADLLGLPLGTILSRVSRARQRLRTVLLGTSKYGSKSQALE